MGGGGGKRVRVDKASKSLVWVNSFEYTTNYANLPVKLFESIISIAGLQLVDILGTYKVCGSKLAGQSWQVTVGRQVKIGNTKL